MCLKSIYARGYNHYGTPRIAADIRTEGYPISANTVSKYMKRNNVENVEKQFIASIEQANDKLKIAGTARSGKKDSPPKQKYPAHTYWV